LNKLGIKAFSLVETLVAAAIIALAVLSVIAVVRKGQEQMTVEKHRRAARAIADTTLEGPRFSPDNYAAIATGVTTDNVPLDASLNAVRTITITGPAALANVPYKTIVVSLQWTEPAGTSAQSVVIERRVPNIPGSINIAPSADNIAASSEYPGSCPFCGDNNFYVLYRWSAVDGIKGLCCQGEWVGNNTDGNSPWITLTWNTPHKIKKIVLYDRAFGSCRATSGTVYLNGSGTAFTTIAIPSCAGGGNCAGGTALFAPQQVTSVRIQLSGAGCPAFNFYGLGEVEIYE
jgi:Tfp pilus assembly protein PilV